MSRKELTDLPGGHVELVLYCHLGCVRCTVGTSVCAHGVGEVLVAFDLCAKPEERLCPCA